MANPVLPSDLAALPLNGPHRIAGRLLVAHEAEVVLADAMAQVRIVMQHPVQHQPGSWLTIDTERQGNAFTQGRLVGVARGQFAPHGEFGRFTRVAARLQQRAVARQQVRGYFAQHAFLEVETPTRVAAPGTDVYLEPISSGSDWLITSPEFHLKRLVVGGIPRVFELARCFREDELGPWHEPEFTLLEWYRAFEGYESVMRDTETLIDGLRQTLEVPQLIRIAGHAVDLRPPFERATARQVFREYAGVADVAALALDDETRYFSLWVDVIEPRIAALGRPLFITEFPASQAALAQATPADASVAERFELFLGPVELCNGYGELTDPKIQRDRFLRDLALREARGLSQPPLDERFLAALEEGLPPAAGNALGFDRLLAVLLGTNIQDVIAFPKFTG
jgi:elongation factor P--(R)-beta-lysine ligase